MASYYDLVIIGAGPGGYTAALKGASFGMKVAVVDENKLGGVCINRGCIPTKALLHASNIFSMMQHGDEFGVSTDFISFDFAKMQDYKKRSVRRYRARSRSCLIKTTSPLSKERRPSAGKRPLRWWERTERNICGRRISSSPPVRSR